MKIFDDDEELKEFIVANKINLIIIGKFFMMEFLKDHFQLL